MALITNKKIRKNKTIFYLSIITLVYFLAVLLIDELKYDAVVIGVFRELLTLPFLALLIVLMVQSIVSLFKEKIISYPFFSLVILILTTALLILKS